MIGTISLSRQVDSHCKNLIDSYGEICVLCNCCGRLNPKTMYACRLRVAKRLLKEFQANVSDPHYQTKLQQRNIQIDIDHFKRQIAYDKGRIKMQKKPKEEPIAH